MNDQGSGDLQTMLEAGGRAFLARYRRPARLAALAPGRVNLIGEHTDYNGGFVLPMAIDRYVLLLAAPVEAVPPGLRIWSDSLGEEVRLPVPTGDGAEAFSRDLHQALAGPGSRRWGGYLAGVLAELAATAGPGWRIPSLEVLVLSNLPLGAGLSSSAALEVATSTLLESASGIRLDPLARAELCRRAEQGWAGVPCGIMDQLVSAAAEQSSALLIDCRSLRWRAAPLPSALSVLVTGSQVRHTLDDGAYARRTAECAEAARRLNVGSLREASAEALAAAAHLLAPELVRRARHVLTENQRTLQAAEALAAGDLATLGSLLYESHRSLRDDFQVSCPELDALVDAAAEMGLAGGVLGARLTGGGFGGSTVTLVRREAADQVAAGLAARFARRTGLRTTPFEVRAVAGARPLELPSRR